MATIRPVQKRILVEPVKQDVVSKGGIYIPEVATGAKAPTKGRVVAISGDVDVKALGIKVGSVVLFNKFAFTEIKMPGLKAGETEQLFLLIKDEHLEAVIDGE